MYVLDKDDAYKICKYESLVIISNPLPMYIFVAEFRQLPE